MASRRVSGGCDLSIFRISIVVLPESEGGVPSRGDADDLPSPPRLAEICDGVRALCVPLLPRTEGEERLPALTRLAQLGPDALRLEKGDAWP
mmetsp:Transcript_49856/g.141005  ORF Transcript_49856/g.141005 Transcript_49856/m.141005 type:complete len:92 (-) Transcript_49856:13-288(-)